MKLVRIDISAFGALRQVVVELDRPMTLVYGPNEAGKSTTLGFIRAMLFGFPPKHAQTAYAPEPSVVQGGSLTFIDEEGRRIRLERWDRGGEGRGRASGEAVLTYEDGRTGGERELRELTGGLTAELYRSLFAFGLTELQELGTMNSEEVSGYLYSAGLGVPGTVIRQAERKLTQEQEQLYKPRGRSPLVNQLLVKLQAAQKRLVESMEQAGHYEQLVSQGELLGRQLVQLEEALERARQKAAYVERCIDARPHVMRLAVIEDELEQLPESLSDVPEDALARDEALEAELHTLECELAELALLIRECEAELVVLEADEEEEARLLEHETELAGYAERAASFEENERQREQAEQEAGRLRGQLSILLRQLGSGWTEEQLDRIEATVVLREEVMAYREQWSSWRQEEVLLGEEERRLFEEAPELRLLSGSTELEEQSGDFEEREEAGLQALIESERVMYDELLQEQQTASSALAELARAGQLLSSWKEALREARHARQRLYDLEQLGGGDKRQSDSAYASMKEPSIALLATLYALTLVLPAALYVLGEPLAALVAMVLLLGGSIAETVRFWYSRQRNRGRSRSRGSSRSQRPYAHDVTTSTLERETKATASELAGIKIKTSTSVMAATEVAEKKTKATALVMAATELAETETAAQSLAPLAAHAAQLAAQLTAALAQLARLGFAAPGPAAGASAEPGAPGARQPLPPEILEPWLEDLAQRLRAREARLAARLRAAERLAALRERQQRHQRAAGPLAARWCAWLRSQALPDAATPDAALELLRLAEAAAAERERLRRAEAHAAALGRETAGFAAAVGARLGPRAAREPAAALRAWREGAERARERMRARALRRERLAELRRGAARLGEQRERAMARRAALYASCGVADDAAAGAGAAQLLRRRCAEAQRQRTLREERRHEMTALRMLLGDSWEQEAARLRQYTAEQLETERSQVKGSIVEESRRLAELHEARSRVKYELEQLADGSTHASRLQEVELCRAEVKQLSRRWAVLGLTSALLERTKRTFEQDKQPFVMQRASHYFASLTEGRYTRAVAPVGEQRVLAELPDGQLVDTVRLSRGTAEQLYISIRLALVDEFASAGVRLPVVMDDLFVNFDEARLACGIELLKQASSRGQLLLFTCHRHVCEAYRRLLPDEPIVQLHAARTAPSGEVISRKALNLAAPNSRLAITSSDT
ncbi:AAA family ATPase [Paenibacillus sp. YYML68]|uniref:AAA family ATPase n=1 Tax=Paenibacillus sp. YYML68 TaxID=2909250 RepID=UPI00248FB14A|nr:AAA family ATPase [Paenibacillus sp. YYML68]